MDDDFDYIGFKNSGAGYSTGSNMLYSYPSAKTTPSQKNPPSKSSEILVRVNPKSTISAKEFSELIGSSKGLPPELKGNIGFNADSIKLPDFSSQAPKAGSEWLTDLGKAGNSWEVTTGRLMLSLNGPTSYLLKQCLQDGEERGRKISSNPDDSLMSPSFDLENIRKRLLLGLTIPSQTMLDKNPPPKGSLPPPQIVRLKSGKGLIIVGTDLIVTKRGKNSDPIKIPNSMIAMSFLHELSAHASFFTLGLDASHSDPRDPLNNPVDRNEQQVEKRYQASIEKDHEAFEKKVKGQIRIMNKKVP